MKRFTQVALLLCIVLMCADPTGVQGQARHSGGHDSHNHGGSSRSGHQSSYSAPSRSKGGHSGSTYHAATRSNNAPSHGNMASSRRPSGAPAVRSGSPSRSGSMHSSPATRGGSMEHRSAPAMRNGNSPRRDAPAMRSSAPAHRPATVHNPGPSHRPAAVHHPGPAHRPAAVHHPGPAHRPAPAYHPHHPGHRFGDRFRALPPRARLYHYAGLDYYFYDGIYYRHHPYGGYYICRPPLGAIFARDVLDAVITAVVFKTAMNAVADCYYNDGVYYQRVNDQYNVIEAPVGAMVTQLPSDYQEITIGGTTYYKVDETLYKVAVYDGQSYFEVVTSI